MHLPEESKSFELCPEGNHLAICTRVIDLGTQTVEYAGQPPKEQRKVYISWLIPEETREDGEPFFIGKRYTLSSNEKASLRKDLESWRGKKFKSEDFGPNGFKIQHLLGVPCFIQVIHNESEGKTYANIQAISQLPKGMAKPDTSKIDTLFLSLEPSEFDMEAFGELGDKMQETIQQSPEWARLTQLATPEAKTQMVESEVGAVETDDEDIPF